MLFRHKLQASGLTVIADGFCKARVCIDLSALINEKNPHRAQICGCSKTRDTDWRRPGARPRSYVQGRGKNKRKLEKIRDARK
jgi:hypothetical protein